MWKLVCVEQRTTSCHTQPVYHCQIAQLQVQDNPEISHCCARLPASALMTEG
jgi:hypothetical protein